MSWQQALSEIESTEFDVKLNVVSSMGAFFRAAAKESVVIDLYQSMRESGDAGEEVLGRIYDLSQLAVDPRYENPKDTPLAILLWLTYFTEPAYGQIAANYVDRAPQCWYAKKLARRILTPPPVASGDAWVGERQYGLEVAQTSSGDTMFIMNPVTQGARPRYYKKAGVPSSTAGNTSA